MATLDDTSAAESAAHAMQSTPVQDAYGESARGATGYSNERQRPQSAGGRGTASGGRSRRPVAGSSLRESRDNVSPGRNDLSAVQVREARNSAGMFFAVSVTHRALVSHFSIDAKADRNRHSNNEEINFTAKCDCYHNAFRTHRRIRMQMLRMWRSFWPSLKITSAHANEQEGACILPHDLHGQVDRFGPRSLV